MVVELKLEIDWESFERIKKNLTTETIIKVIKATLKEVTEIPLEAFESTVETWENAPSFQVEISDTADGAKAEIFTIDEIYRYVSEGTRPHRIPTSGISARPMPVGPPGTPKTQPGRLRSQAGFRPPPEIFARTVEHPGIYPRKFPRQILEQKGREISQKFGDIFLKRLKRDLRRRM